MRGRFAAAIACTLALCSVCGSELYAHGSNPENPGSVKKNGRFTPNTDGAQFPPQPQQIANGRLIGPVRNSRAEINIAQQSLRRVLADPEVTEALGERFAHIHSAPVRSKNNGVGSLRRHLFFSHSNNQTVVVLSAANRVQSVSLEAAADNQPALGQTELTEAIDLARNYWLDRGKDSVNTLTGYAIQTFQQDGSPFSTRMVYVSFHTTSPEPPLLYNNVDLTLGEVVTGEEE